MYSRLVQLDPYLNDMSIFLFGARQTGKSTLLRHLYPQAVYIDLLNTEVYARYSRRPNLLYEMYHTHDVNTLIIIDEIQQVPLILNEVHRLMSERGIRFILCGSSARKLRRQGYNTLGGRAYPCYLYPLVSAEIPDFDLDKALSYGMLPAIYTSSNATLGLSAYIDVYLREEIKAEALVRNLDSFQRFLDIAALTDGEIVNYNNIATDCWVSAHTVKEYFQILEDTLLGYTIPAYTKTIKRRLIQSPKFYLMDVGIVNYLLHRNGVVSGTAEYGHSFEHFVIQELVAYIGYHHKQNQLCYWRTSTGLEVDAIVGESLAIEIKSVTEVQNKHLKGLRAFREEHPDFTLMIVSLDPFTRQTEDNIQVVYIHDFLAQLWSKKLF